MYFIIHVKQQACIIIFLYSDYFLAVNRDFLTKLHSVNIAKVNSMQFFLEEITVIEVVLM